MIYQNCPFCGNNKAKLFTNRTVCGYNGLDMVVYRHRAYVRCLICNARGPLASGRVIQERHPFTADWEESPLEINQEAVNGWNDAVAWINRAKEQEAR